MKTVTFDESSWKLVPIDPTPEMTLAAHLYYQNAMTKFGDFAPLGIYTSMLAAAPAAPEQEV